MFGFSMGEILLVAIVIIIFTDPKDLPEFARRVARFMRKVKSFGNEFTSVINKEFTEPKSYIKGLKGEMQKTYDISEMKTSNIPVIPAQAGISSGVAESISGEDPRLRGDDSKS